MLDENMNVLKMYDTPVITGNVTTAIVDTEHGKALKISKSGQLNIYEGKNEIHFQQHHGRLKEDKQTSDEFFRRFTISMSNYTSPGHFIDMPSDEFDSKIDAWVYSDSEIEKFSFYFGLDPKNSNINRIALSIMTDEGRVHLRKGWQVVNLSLGKLMWD